MLKSHIKAEVLTRVQGMVITIVSTFMVDRESYNGTSQCSHLNERWLRLRKGVRSWRPGQNRLQPEQPEW